MDFFPIQFLVSALLVAAAFIIFGMIIIRLNNTSLPPVYPTPLPLQLGGWLIVIAVLFGIGLIFSFFGLFSLKIWEDDFWVFDPNDYAPPFYYLNMALNVLIALDVVFGLTFGGFCLYLFIKRRDITPRVVTYFLVISIIINVITVAGIVTTYIPGLPDGLPRNLQLRFLMIQLLLLVISILITSLIVRYMNSSVRSKETFVLPHPSLVDHEYPDFEIQKDVQ